MYRIRFDSFIHNVIMSEPTIQEPISIMQRFDFGNGYGEELLLTHIRILGRTFISESKHKKITMKTFQHMAKLYDNIQQHDLELAYSIINPQKESHIGLHVLKTYFMTLTETSLSTIMKTLYKDQIGNAPESVYTLKTNIPKNYEKSISILEEEYKNENKTPIPKPTPKPMPKSKKRISFCQKWCRFKLFP